ncbi:MAG: hypothetical protein IKE91_02825 [Clostridia bacterium]|nr:hypothetical protein [Clostridia bacterium]
MNARFIQRMEALRLFIIDELGMGTFADLPADEFGITPETRMQWGIDSISYIIGIGYSVEDRLGNKNQMMLKTCHNIEAISGDPYIAEGIFNIRWVLTVLAMFEQSYAGEDDESPGGVMNECYYQTVKSMILGRKIQQYESRYQSAKKEAIRLTMLLNQIAPWVERNWRSVGNH